uniref:ZF-HD dimerization-type domain-containing protein n=1 Tax=Kalanchoe fedtschenkoi TaxID=63787 RepID=A0A7N0ULM3_KALFE
MDQFGHDHQHGEEMEEEEMVPPHESLTGLRRLNVPGEGGSSGAGSGRRAPLVRYRECLKNHAVGSGGHALDGCGEFIAAGEDGTLESLTCAACNCHRNFHRKETDGESAFHPNAQFSPYYHRSPPPGFLHMALPPSRRPLALPSREEHDDMSNPSSSGGVGGGGRGAGSTPGGGSKKRFRTKFTAEQKERMMELAERLGWRLQRQDDALVQQFCAENGLSRQVLKVWMHNNKNTLGKK